MSNIKFDDYLNQQFKDSEFKEAFESENERLESAIAVTKVTKRQYYKCVSINQLLT